MLLGVDVGGTFTDAVLVDGNGALFSAKVPTTPSEQSSAVLEAVGLVLAGAHAEPEQVQRFAHGMTVATNALLEGHTARTALVATEGFTDVLELGRQARPHLYRLCDAAPTPLVEPQLRFGAPERMRPDGPLRALEPTAARTLVAAVADAEPQAVAVSLLHSYAHPAHEQLLAALLAELLPQVHCSLSSDLVGTFREFERTATTVLDAALSPLLEAYLRRLSGQARAAKLPEPQIMQSSGGLTESAHACAHAALTVLSGPAGGVGGALLLAELAGEREVLCFDMGGTSCDVCLIEDARVAETAARTVAGRPLALPALDIHTVGAGGGSIAWIDDGGALRVGPHSAGADPGPACYGRGGEQPTVTDANLVLGRLDPDVPLAGQVRLDPRAARTAVAHVAGGFGSVEEAAAGIVAVANQEMVRAIRVVSVERGHDPRDVPLCAFGGAGPLHACEVADVLGIRTVVVPPASGVLSALGIAAGERRRDAVRSVMEPLAGLRARDLRGRIPWPEGGRGDRREATADLRYAGQGFELEVELEPLAALPERFHTAHARRYGFDDRGSPIEVVNLRGAVIGRAPVLLAAGGRRRRPVHGPARIHLDGATLWVADGWTARSRGDGGWVVTR